MDGRNVIIWSLDSAPLNCLGEDLKLAVLSRHVTRLAKRFFGIPDFHYYALADGITHLLAWCAKGPIKSRSPTAPPDPQLLLFPIAP